MIKYAYANCQREIIHIEDVTEEMRLISEYSCICCGNRMVAHLNGSRRKHFQHYEATEHDFETYLHKTAKQLFIQSYKKAIVDIIIKVSM